MLFGRQYVWMIVLVVAGPVATGLHAQGSADRRTASISLQDSSASERILVSIEAPALRELASEVLKRNPGLAAAEAGARAAAQRASQVAALPDPVASLTAFLQTPETRTGPQRLSVGVSQGVPWIGKLALREQAALYAATAMEAEVEAKRLALVTEVRRLFYELAFLARYEQITGSLLDHLSQHEEIARARYSTGVGAGQGVVKLQAELTRVEKRLLEIESRRVAVVAQLNALRDAPASAKVPDVLLPTAEETRLDRDVLLEAARRFRPELVAADARIARAETMIRLAEKGYRPDFTVGLMYTFVDPRDDTPGRLAPPEGNGDDVIGIQGGISLPVRRKKLAAGVEEASELELSATKAKQELVARIEAAIGDLTQRVPLGWRQLRLVDDLLIVQAEEALESAKAGYIAGRLNALDLLDAEHVLFEAHTAVARATADFLVDLAKLEGELGGSLKTTQTTERSES